MTFNGTGKCIPGSTNLVQFVYWQTQSYIFIKLMNYKVHFMSLVAIKYSSMKAVLCFAAKFSFFAQFGSALYIGSYDKSYHRDMF